MTTIGDKAFTDCKALTSITIPNSVTEIGLYAFIGCESLTSITIPESVKTIGDCAFWGCGSLTSITIPNSVTTIGYRAFHGCESLTSITILEGVTKIGMDAFCDCKSLTSITIPNSVTKIGRGAFRDCQSLRDVYVEKGCTERVRKLLAGTGARGDLVFHEIEPAAKVSEPAPVSRSTFGARETVNGVTYNYSIENGRAAIEGEDVITPAISKSTSGALVIPSTLGGCPVTTIGESAFFCCKSLTSITIPEVVTTIGEGAFFDCDSLTSITIPKSVTTIGKGAFAGCVKLQAINIAEENSGYRSVDGVLYSKEGGTLLAVPGALTSITIPEGVTTIGERAFGFCESLKSVTIPKSVTTIGNGAFLRCDSLTSITIPNSVTTIGGEAFFGCGSLRDVYVDKGCTERVRGMLEAAGASDDLVIHEPFSIVDILVGVGAVALLGGAVCIVLIRRKKRR